MGRAGRYERFNLGPRSAEHFGEVLRRIEGGWRLTVTLGRRRVAEIVPLWRRRMVPIEEARNIASPSRRGSKAPRTRGLLPNTTDDA